MTYRTEPCRHCRRHSRTGTDVCMWCFRPFKGTPMWLEAVKLTAAVVFFGVILALVLL